MSAPEKQATSEVEDKDTKTEKETPTEKEHEKEKEKGNTLEEKKKKKSPDTGRKINSSPATGPKSVGTSKSAGDLRKGRTTPGKAEGASASTVKKSVSSTLVRKEAATLRKSPSTDIKKDSKGKTPPRTNLATTVKK